MKRCLAAAAALVAFATHTAAAQSDTTASADAPSRFTYGATFGAMSFPGGFGERGISVVGRVRLANGFAIGVTPAYARVTDPASLGGTSASGWLDTPVELTWDHALALPHAPVLGLGVSASLPTGDTIAGFGSGRVGYSIEGGVGYSPADKLWLHAGAGKPLTDFSSMGALGGSGTTWGDLSLAWSPVERLAVDAGYDGDLAGSDTVAGAARALVAGASWTIAPPLTLDAHLLHGVSGPAARWSLTIGLGTDFAYLASLGSTSPTQSATAGVGGQSHGKGWGSGTTKTTGAGNAKHGRGRP